MVDNNSMLVLLKIISVNSSLSPLIGKGYTYAQAALMIEEARKNGLVEYAADNDILLSELGKTLLAEHFSKEKLFGSKRWIMPQDIYRTTPLKRSDVIFPKKL